MEATESASSNASAAAPSANAGVNPSGGATVVVASSVGVGTSAAVATNVAASSVVSTSSTGATSPTAVGSPATVTVVTSVNCCTDVAAAAMCVLHGAERLHGSSGGGSASPLTMDDDQRNHDCNRDVNGAERVHASERQWRRSIHREIRDELVNAMYVKVNAERLLLKEGRDDYVGLICHCVDTGWRSYSESSVRGTCAVCVCVRRDMSRLYGGEARTRLVSILLTCWRYWRTVPPCVLACVEVPDF